MESGRICFQFRDTGSCKFKNCKYIHHAGQSKSRKIHKVHSAGAGKNRATSDKVENESSSIKENDDTKDLITWTKAAKQGQFGGQLGPRLAWFFKLGARLIHTSDEALQSIIRCLASEGGLSRIQELIQRDYSTFADPEKLDLFQNKILPFIEIISDRKVQDSLVIEQALGTIYNSIWGISGRRGEPFLGFLAEMLQKEVDGHSNLAIPHLELCLSVFLQVIEVNSTAYIHEPLKPITTRFHDCFLALHGGENSGVVAGLEKARNCLERLEIRLEMGLTLPKLFSIQEPHPDSNNKRPSSKERPIFIVDKEPPGGRHNNDHADICKIQTMPTYAEIMSDKSEYLPFKDPEQWLLNGISGLLDWNFRLLREDSIGPLRDGIRSILLKLKVSGQKNQVRMNIYKEARIQGLKFDRFGGMQVLVQFAQPANIKSMSKDKREKWWEESKRLQSTALVCLTGAQGLAVFCTVAANPRPSRDRRHAQQVEDKQEDLPSLSENAHVASVLLELVEPSEINWRSIINQYSSRQRASSLSLVEVPGVLLPSFQPTLLALQQMKKAADLPMSDFLVPSIEASSLSDGMAHVPPPAYAATPGFSFNLKCLMYDSSDLEVKVSQPVDVERLQKHSSLDKAQAFALVRSLQRRIALIQGPPGTGKSYTGVALIKVLLANKMKLRESNSLGPIICVCYTNHALDQLLEDLLKNKTTTQIIRIGSQSKSDALKDLNIRKVASQVDGTRTERSNYYTLQRDLDSIETDFGSLALEKMGSDKRLDIYLKDFHPFHYGNLFGKDENGFKRTGTPQSILKSWLNSGKPGCNGGRTKPRRLQELAKVHVDNMTAEERRVVYQNWIEGRKEEIHQRLQALICSYGETKRTMDRIREERDLRCLRKADVVGLTTTGLARNLNMLRRLRSKVVICEEAGEVLEAHLLTSFLPSVEHVILIGDHQQLRPQIQNYGLSRESKDGVRYALDRSLFERLVEPDDGRMSIPFCTLETQRRMHPSISQLIRDTLYPGLQDAPSVSEYSEVVGLQQRLFWLDHQRPEGNAANDDALATSHWNDFEIEMVTNLVNHLIRQGVYRSHDIAVLTPYLGQLHRIRRKLAGSYTITLGERDQEDLDKAGFTDSLEPASNPGGVTKATLLQSLRAATIDNFQGEEAKVVVISLVRSNNENRCGFLRTPNRINVLLSRAKHGMYIIGNSKTATKDVEMWRKVVGILDRGGNFGTQLLLKCPRHPDDPIAVSKPEDFVQLSPEGGCSLQCSKRLQCGHPCKQKCHANFLHQAVHCLEPCPRPQKGCEHPCPKPCGDKCPSQCLVPVFDPSRVLPCGHSKSTLPCWQSQKLDSVKCQQSVKKKVPNCEHVVNVPCHVDVASSSYLCQNQCLQNLPCGHKCKRQCSACLVKAEGKMEVDHGKCQQKCGRLYTTCSHSCEVECHGSEPCQPCASKCDTRCGHSKCSQKCSDPCPPCAVSQCFSTCPHSSCSMPCAAPCDHIPCSLRCAKALPCGHQCPSICGELCPEVKFCQLCGTDEIKDTTVDFIMGESYREINLDENPCIFPPCGHFLTMESMDAQMDIKKHYNTDDQERPVSISTPSKPFSIADIRTCATCRGSLRSVSRYGRLVRRALLDEATKKFILFLNQRYVPLAHALRKNITALQEMDDSNNTRVLREMDGADGASTFIEGSPFDQVRVMSSLVNKADERRWRDLLILRHEICEYHSKVKVEEQPFSQVRNMVEDARRRKRAAHLSFEFDESVLQTKGVIQATSLLLRLDIALLADFLSLKFKDLSPNPKAEFKVDLDANRKEAVWLIETARSCSRVLYIVEGYLFQAQLCALEQRWRSRHNSDKESSTSIADALLEEGKNALAMAKEFSARYPDQTRGMDNEISATEEMLGGRTFYTPVTDEERMAVVNAMAREFRGTGHWYYCVNGHPFTIGECGGAMQTSTCPECGSQVGGEHHRTVAGVTAAPDLENRITLENRIVAMRLY